MRVMKLKFIDFLGSQTRDENSDRNSMGINEGGDNHRARSTRHRVVA